MTNALLRISLSIATAAMFLQPCHAVPPTIQFSPQSPISLSANQSTSGGPPMTITCTQPQVAGTSTLVSLYIKRVPTTGGAEQILVYADINNKVPLVAPGVTGITADGNLDTRSIRGTITQMSCDKAGLYICESSYLSTAETVKDRVTANYTVDVTPGSVDIVYSAVNYDPSGAGSVHGVGDSVQFTCSANVGSVDSTTRVDFNWEYETVYNGLPSFTSYPNSEDINSETPAPPTSGACSTQTWRSILVRNLTLEDSERRYRCYVTKNGVGYSDHAAYYTLPTVENPDITDDSNHTTTVGICSTQTWKSFLVRNLTADDSERRYRCYVTKNDVVYKNHAAYYTLPVVENTDGSVGAIVRGVMETVTILVIIAVVTAIN